MADDVGVHVWARVAASVVENVGEALGVEVRVVVHV